MTTRRLRVGLLSAGQEAGGVERYVCSLARSLASRCQPVLLSVGESLDAEAMDEDGVEAVAISASEPGWRAGSGRERNRRSATAIVARHLPDTPATDRVLATLRVAAVGRNRVRAQGILRSLELDVLHVHNGGHPASAAALGHLLAAADVGIPVRGLTAHGTPRRYGAVPRSRERALDQEIWEATHFITAVSQATAGSLSQLRCAPRGLMRVVETAIEQITPVPAAQARERLGMSSDAPVVAMLADMRRGKRHDLLVRATQVIAQRHPDVSVLLAGDGPHRQDVQRLVHRLGLEPRVLMPGRLPRELVLGAATVVALLTDGEALPLSLLEAMSVGLPVVGSDVGGVSELIVNDRSGILVESGTSPAELGHVVSALLNDKARCARLGMAAREQVAPRTTIEQMTDAYWSLYTCGSPG